MTAILILRGMAFLHHKLRRTDFWFHLISARRHRSPSEMNINMPRISMLSDRDPCVDPPLTEGSRVSKSRHPSAVKAIGMNTLRKNRRTTKSQDRVSIGTLLGSPWSSIEATCPTTRRGIHPATPIMNTIIIITTDNLMPDLKETQLITIIVNTLGRSSVSRVTQSSLIGTELLHTRTYFLHDLISCTTDRHPTSPDTWVHMIHTVSSRPIWPICKSLLNDDDEPYPCTPNPNTQGV